MNTGCSQEVLPTHMTEEEHSPELHKLPNTTTPTIRLHNSLQPPHSGLFPLSNILPNQPLQNYLENIVMFMPRMHLSLSFRISMDQMEYTCPVIQRMTRVSKHQKWKACFVRPIHCNLRLNQPLR
jgi:hypothetical protein